MNNSIKNIIFDLDGTLINSNLASLQSLQQAIKIVENRFFKIEELKIVLGLSDFDAFKVLGINNISSCYYFWEKFSKELDKEKTIFPEVIETLSQLKSIGINLGIVTSREKKRYNDNNVIMSNLNHFFDIVVTSELTIKHKPNPEPLLKWIELSKCDPTQAIYIGDTKHDYICAQKAGVSFGLAAWGLHQEVKTNLLFNKPSQILKLFE